MLADCPNAMVLTSTFSVLMVSKIATTAYGEPPADAASVENMWKDPHLSSFTVSRHFQYFDSNVRASRFCPGHVMHARSYCHGTSCADGCKVQGHPTWCSTGQHSANAGSAV